MSLADGDLVDADGDGGGRSGALQLLPHVLLVELLHRFPVEMRLLGHVLDRGGSAAPPNEEGKTLRVERVVRQPVELFTLHSAAVTTGDPANLHPEVHPPIPAGEVTNPAPSFVIVTLVPGAADAAFGFFRRRVRVTTTAFGSPKMPQISGLARKPEKR